MKAVDRKLLRDLWALKTQVVSIALVIACGIGGLIASFSTYDSLLYSREHYYDTARFPHVFATAKRAPQSLEEKIRAIPGVSEVETRVVRDARRQTVYDHVAAYHTHDQLEVADGSLRRALAAARDAS